MWRLAVVLGLALGGCPSEGGAQPAVCVEWEEHKRAVLDGELAGGAMRDDMQRMGTLAVKEGAPLSRAGRALLEAADSGDSADAYADMELACTMAG